MTSPALAALQLLPSRPAGRVPPMALQQSVGRCRSESKACTTAQAGDQRRVQGAAEASMFLRCLKSRVQSSSSLLATPHRCGAGDSRDLPRAPAHGVTECGPEWLPQGPGGVL